MPRSRQLSGLLATLRGAHDGESILQSSGDIASIGLTGATAPAVVWLAGPTAASHFDAEALNDADRQRYANLRGEQRRTEFAVSRALRAYAIKDRCTPSSLSHSSGWAALAAAPPGCRVGVDLEWSRPRNLLGLAKFAFAADEIAWLTSLSGAEREPMFYALWTLKESMAKALGLPLLAATRECVFSAHDGQWRGRAPIDQPWSALSFQPRPDVTLAIVLVGKSSLDSIATLEWPPERSVQWVPLARVINP